MDRTLAINLAALAAAYKAMGDPVRLRILQLLPRSAANCQDLYNVNELSEELAIPQPTVSHHLKILRQAGLIRFTKKCNSVYYYRDARRFRDCWRELNESVLSRN
jgi:ArsR family transcriptional regulator